MDLDKYQKRAAKYDLFETTTDLNSPGFLEKILGLAGEAGEAADKVKKILRDKGGYANEQDKAELAKELGDVLWYIANVARYLDMDLSDIAKGNIEKLSSRQKRNKLHGEGDNR